jgi:hypothetical protein
MKVQRFVMTMVVAACIACTGASDVSDAIGKLARRQPVFRLDQATPFAWDHVVFFTPYLPRETVCTALNIAAKDCSRLIPFESVDDSQMTLAFIRQGVLVRYVLHTLNNGNFLPIPSGTVMTRDEAVFRANYSGIGAFKVVRAHAAH